MIWFESKGNFEKTRKFLSKFQKGTRFFDLNRYGMMGVRALSQGTPEDTGLTSDSWEYRIIQGFNSVRIEWYNTNDAGGTSVAILIQYGHATGTGGYVVGRDFVNPAMRPVFDKIADEIWKKVKS